MIPVNTKDGRCINTRSVNHRLYVVLTNHRGEEELLSAADLDHMADGIRKLEDLTNPVNRSSFAQLKREMSSNYVPSCNGDGSCSYGCAACDIELRG